MFVAGKHFTGLTFADMAREPAGLHLKKGLRARCYIGVEMTDCYEYTILLYKRFNYGRKTVNSRSMEGDKYI
jgi:hypothetical protein